MLLALSLTLSLSGCFVGTVVGTVVDVGIEVVKVPFKLGKAVYDVSSSGGEEKKAEKKDAKK